ncbi:5-formyltetrahydrofolate cyclo-ligase [Enterobacteriaceae bacterium BIT-l23]|uniref:5-formyltetrahydrofolate cyclo-ligase n=1 Tax=Jejubacter sp. L23 TaxID=3092086 RepID=UPI001584CC45|nr:5-formyltetrahydrofolate cyclo-ligase [Enterobacteriaceae bacterium BIT-l23]
MTQRAITPQTRQQIRQMVRERRRALSTDQQQLAARQATQRLLAYAPVRQAKRVALFLSFDGELDTRPAIEALWADNREVYLPVLHPFSTGNLLFLRYTPQTELRENRLKIAEPPLDVRQVLALDALDALVVPLVAFDTCGQRLGMGGGFYDRTLQNWRSHGFAPVGYAHDCQQVESLPVEHWDIPLPAMVTPSRLWQW